MSEAKQRKASYWVYCILTTHVRVKGMVVGHNHTSAWGFQRCSFNYTGQFQSLSEWNEQQVWLSRLNQYILCKCL